MVNLKSKDLPVIMYDQTQFMSFSWLGKKGVYLSEETYNNLEKLSGYKPETWYLYTQAEPETFFFGAYPQEVLDKEAEIGLKNIQDNSFIANFETNLKLMYEKAKEVKDIYLKNIKDKELELIKNRSKELAEFLMKLKENDNFIMQFYLLTQPQRFYAIEERINKVKNNHELIFLMENGRELSPLSKIRIAFLKYALKKDQKSLNQLKIIVEEIGFLNQSVLGGEPLTLEGLKKEIPNILKNEAKFSEELKQLEQQQEKIKQKEEIFNKNKENKDYQIAERSGQMLLNRITMQTYILSILYYNEHIVAKLGEFYKLQYGDLLAYSFEDLLELVLKGKKKEETIIQERRKGLLAMLTHEGMFIFQGEEARTKIKELLESRTNEIKTAKGVTGKVASWPDKSVKTIRGRAFVLSTAFDADKIEKIFEENSILLATQTHPSLVPLMTRASAIVTDEGGLTCHAAIVSRELNKPCIIGTKIATKIIKNKDIIELDLSTGSVKILEKNKNKSI